jgi:protoheme ferro-lyase/glutamyl-tRNA reductase
MSPRPLRAAPAPGALPARAAPPVPVRRPRAALLVACAGPAGPGRDADALRRSLESHASRLTAALPALWRVLVAVHGARPSVAEALDEVEAAGIEDLVVVPLYPCFSQARTGDVARHLYRLLAQGARPSLNVAIRGSWYDDVGYVSAQAAVVAGQASGHELTPPRSHLLFSAPAPPLDEPDRGDPYLHQIRRTAQLVAERLGWPESRTSLAFDGGADRVARLGAATAARLTELLEAGERAVLVCPLADLASEPPGADDAPPALSRVFDEATGHVYRCPPLTGDERFAAVLRDLVLRGVRPVTSCREAPAAPVAPIRAESAEPDPAALVMVGVALASGPPSERRGPLRHSTPETFLRIKKTRKALRAFLEGIRDEPLLDEAFVWDTCQRVECYGWLAEPDDPGRRERIVAALRRRLFDGEPEGLAVNVLAGPDVWRHLMRTACGLNSRVPGDTDVLQQLQTARHIAETARAAGPRAAALVAEASRLAERVRAETGWGAVSTGYCRAALAQVEELRSPRAAEGHHVVIGGSTTSRSILGALTDQFDVPQRQLTLVYRDHHGQMKLLRSALGHGRRLRVHAYDEACVLRAIADADFVYFGLDQAEPVLHRSRLAELRDLAARPLTILDFNSFGSLAGAAVPDGVTVWSAQALDGAVAAHAESVWRRAEFRDAMAEAERWIERSAPWAAAPAGLPA